MNFPSGSGTRSGSGRSHVHRGNDDSVSIGRTRDYMRAFKACESCRRKKTRCILDAPDGAPAACRKCKRERKPCSLSQQPTSSTGVMDGPLTDAHGSYQGDDKIESNECIDPEDDRDPGSEDPMACDATLSSLEDPLQQSATIHSRLSEPAERPVPKAQGARIPDFGSIYGFTGNGAREGDTVMRASISNEGDTMRVLQQSSRHQQDRGADEEINTPGQSVSSGPGSFRMVGPFLSDLSRPSTDILRLWNSLRFVRMGWLTAREAVSYIDLFFENLSPLSPILDGFYSKHDNHYSLITQEPLLCCTLLMISSRFHCLQGVSSWSRSVALHDRLWEHCQHLVTRIIFGQEKKSKAKTRTAGSIQALMLMTEWAPRAVYFPPKSDGWDADLLFQLPDDRDLPGANEADVTMDLKGNWFRDVIAPAKMIDRMSWMLLGCAVTLGHEIGIFRGPRADMTAPGLNTAQLQQQLDYRSSHIWLRKVIFIADEHFSSRVGSTSLIPSSLTTSAFEPLLERSSPEEEQKRRFVSGQLALAELAKSISKALFSSKSSTLELVQSYRYIDSIETFQRQLTAWREAYLNHQALSQHAFELLLIEYYYNVIFLNSLGMQAIVDRSAMNMGNNTSPSNRVSATWMQSFATSADLRFVVEVIEGGCQIIQSAVRLANTGTLQYCPTRVITRVIAASVFLLKALGLGVERARLETSLSQLQDGIEALRKSTRDDLELASRYAAVLDDHIEQYRKSFVTQASRQDSFAELHPTTAPNEAPVSDVGEFNFIGIQAFQNPQEWLSMPLDISMAPFGVATDEGPETDGLYDGDWSLLWNLPLFPG